MESIKSIWSVVKNVLSPEKVVPANAVPIVPVDNPGQERVPKIAPTPDNTDEKLGRIPAAAEFDQHTPGQDHGTSPTSSTPVSENSSTTLDSSTQLVSPETDQKDCQQFRLFQFPISLQRQLRSRLLRLTSPPT